MRSKVVAIWTRDSFNPNSPVVYTRGDFLPMDVDLEAVLAAKKAQYKSTEVQKDVELQYDLGNLLATDLNPLDAQALKYG